MKGWIVIISGGFIVTPTNRLLNQGKKMIKILGLTLLLIPAIAWSEVNMQNFDMQKMQAMMLEMQKMQICMAKVDQKKLESLGIEAQKMETEIKQLCAAGNKSQAQKKALGFMKKTKNNDAFVQLKKCTESLDVPMMKEQLKSLEIDESEQICDLI